MPTQVMKAFSRNIELETHSLQKPSYIPVIAEIGINHNGDLDIAKQLIKMASDAGCDAVKFQKRDIETVYSPEVLDAPRERALGDQHSEIKRRALSSAKQSMTPLTLTAQSWAWLGLHPHGT